MDARWNFDLYIGGEWTAGEATRSIEVINPATEEVIGTVPSHHQRRHPGHRGGPEGLR